MTDADPELQTLLALVAEGRFLEQDALLGELLLYDSLRQFLATDHHRLALQSENLEQLRHKADNLDGLLRCFARHTGPHGNSVLEPLCVPRMREAARRLRCSFRVFLAGDSQFAVVRDRAGALLGVVRLAGRDRRDAWLCLDGEAGEQARYEFEVRRRGRRFRVSKI